MLTREFAKTGAIRAMRYNKEKGQLVVVFAKQERFYEGVPTEIATKFYYAADKGLGNVYSYYATNVKGKFQVSEIKPIK